MKPKRERKPTRLKGYDYSSPGIYFVTICTYQRACLFGDVIDQKMRLNTIGKIVEQTWKELPNHHPNIKIEPFVIMPNHVHGLIEIEESRGGLQTFRSENPPLPRKTHGLSEIIRGFKTWSARRVNEAKNTKGTPLWQRSFHDRIIRDEKHLHTTIEYIQSNSLRWLEDEEYIDKNR